MSEWKEFDGMSREFVKKFVYRTAIKRRKLSAPAQWLKDHGYLKGRVLDFGCGRGDDADILHCWRYDPHYFPRMPEGEFSTILCTYVLNVIPEEEGYAVIEMVQEKLLEDTGKAYFAVRRDITDEVYTSRGTYQRPVDLGSRHLIHVESGRYAIYEFTKGDVI